MRPSTCLTLIAALAAGTGCDRTEPTARAAVVEPGSSAITDATPPWLYVESGDLSAIRAHGKLRALTQLEPELSYLPRGGARATRERDLAEGLARDLGVELVLVPVANHEQLMQHLLDGKGDIALGHSRLDPALASEIALTVAFRTVHAVIVSRTDGTAVSGVADLAGRRLAVQESSPFARTARALADAIDGLELEIAPETLAPLDVIAEVAEGTYDLAVTSDRWLDIALQYRDDVVSALQLDDSIRLTAAVRAGAQQLRKAVDLYLIDALIAGDTASGTAGDLAEIKSRKVMRVALENGPGYFTDRGQLRGFEYELVKRFADRLDVSIQVVVPPERADAVRWLRAGKADLVATTLTPADVGDGTEVRLTRPYRFSAATVVGAAGRSKFAGTEDLAETELHIPEGSVHWPGLRILAADLPASLIAAPPHLDAIADGLRRGDYPLLVIDRDELGALTAGDDSISPLLDLPGEVALHWAVPAGASELAAALDSYLKSEYRGTVYNVLRRRYFGSRGRPPASAPRGDGSLSPFDDIVRRVAANHGVDWRLIVAQMYQESRFDPKARSRAGALGLMQVLPRTARQMGRFDLTDPRQSVEAGVAYLDWLRQRFEPGLPDATLMAFMLASYNAGYGHVSDARKVAERNGWDPNRWSDNVERAMLLLMRRDVARTVRHGYCRGTEPVRYVRDITERFRAYARLTDEPSRRIATN